MANMDVTDREGYERSTLSDSGAQIRRGSEKGAAIYSVLAVIIGAALCYAAFTTIEGWAQWLVLAVLVVFTIALAFAVGPNRAGAGQASSPESL
jgi:1,4-dihydroxy-2-naphthoate octaprenyltransferase